MLKKIRKNKKGFTLAELLIVVAIIAVLVAISIPIFNSQLEKSRDAVSVSNIRAAYAEAQTAVLTNGTGVQTSNAAITDGNVTITSGFNFGTITGEVTVSGVNIKSQKSDHWSGEATELPWNKDKTADKVLPEDAGSAKNNATITFTYTNGSITNVTYA